MCFPALTGIGNWLSVPKEDMDRLNREMVEMRKRLADIEEEVSQYSNLYWPKKTFFDLVLFGMFSQGKLKDKLIEKQQAMLQDTVDEVWILTKMCAYTHRKAVLLED